MTYNSEIRTVNPYRKNYNTTYDSRLYGQLKLLAKKLDVPTNQLTEEGIRHILRTHGIEPKG